MATEYDFSFDSGSSAVHNSITVTISVAVEAIRNFNFVSDSSSVHNSITVTISVAVEAICNFNFDSSSCRVYSSITTTMSVAVGAISNFNFDHKSKKLHLQWQFRFRYSGATNCSISVFISHNHLGPAVYYWTASSIYNPKLRFKLCWILTCILSWPLQPMLWRMKNWREFKSSALQAKCYMKSLSHIAQINENLKRTQVFSLAGKMLHEEFSTHCTTKCPSSGLCILCALQWNLKSTNCKNENLKRIQVFSLSGKMLHEEFAAHCTTKCPLSEQHWATEWPLHLECFANDSLKLPVVKIWREFKSLAL